MSEPHPAYRVLTNKLYREAGRRLAAGITGTIELTQERPKTCSSCGKYRADPPSTLCTGCEAYQEHTA